MINEDFIQDNHTGIKILIHASAWFAPFLIPLIFLLLVKEKELQRLSLEAMLFQVIFGLLTGISILFSYILIGIPFLIIFGAIYLIAPVGGIIYAVQNRHFRYPIANRFTR